MIKGLLTGNEVLNKEKISNSKFLYEPLLVSGHVNVTNENIIESLIMIRRALSRLFRHFDYDNNNISSLSGISMSSLRKIFVVTDVGVLDIARISSRFYVPISIFVSFNDGTTHTSKVDISPENLSTDLRSKETWDIEKEFRKKIIELIKISCANSKNDLKRAVALLGLNSEAEKRILAGYYWSYEVNTLFAILMHVASVRIDFDFSNLESSFTKLEKARSEKPKLDQALIEKKKEESYNVREFAIKKNRLPESIREQRDFFFYFTRCHGYAMRDIGELCGKNASMISNVKLKPTVRLQTVLNVTMLLGIGVVFRYSNNGRKETALPFVDNVFGSYKETTDYIRGVIKERLGLEVRNIVKDRELTINEVASTSA